MPSSEQPEQRLDKWECRVELLPNCEPKFPEIKWGHEIISLFCEYLVFLQGINNMDDTANRQMSISEMLIRGFYLIWV